jgi:hypothetical protein
MKMNYTKLIEETNSIIKSMKEQFKIVTESEGIDNLFNDLKVKLGNITMLPNNVINASKYQEHQIVDVLRGLGYEYKKPMGNKLHFFNKKTSISVYVGQQNRYITLQP